MSKAIINVSDIIMSSSDKNQKYLWYRITDNTRNIFSESSINYKVKVSNSTSSSISSTSNPFSGVRN